MFQKCIKIAIFIFHIKKLQTNKFSLCAQFNAIPVKSKSSVEKMKILNVAEKNDAAKNIAGFLSNGNNRRREGISKFNKIYEFDYNFRGNSCTMVMTSVSGHLLTHEFVGHYRAWHSCNPVELFDCPVQLICPKDYENIKKTLEREIRSCNILIIWTDCDREGENIGYEIINVCRQIKSNITVYRAKFSEITGPSVRRAMATLEEPNKRMSDAVNVRSELDLRIGASFTRFQTLRLKKVFPEILGDSLISYGSCQFPTLGFVVERYKEIEKFVAENFWKIKVTHEINELAVEFNWKRVRLFDELFVQVLLNKCLENKMATVIDVTSKQKNKWRPTPLDTVELEKLGSKKLSISAKETLKIAEKLYTQGYISYPRTETNIFPKEINLTNLVQMQMENSRWGNFANKIINELGGPNPRQGKKSDEAHPPIHPTKHAELSGNEGKVYELIVRHFLACVSKDAIGHETKVTIDINNEQFTASGLVILERNYLEVYIYERWTGKEIHHYEQGQTFQPTSIEKVEGQTSAPNLLTESELISLMEKHGIGTDATYAEHIETIKSREYVGLSDGIHFIPGQLGAGLVDGYDDMGFEMSKPHLRSELEADLKRICDGIKDPAVVLQEQINKYKHVFQMAWDQAIKLDTALAKWFQVERNSVTQQELGPTNGAPCPVLKCPLCNYNMTLKTRTNGTFYLGCVGYPACKSAVWFPNNVIRVSVCHETCPNCGPDVKLLKMNFKPGSALPYFPNEYIGCVNGCDRDIIDYLGIEMPRNSSSSSTTTSSRSSGFVSDSSGPSGSTQVPSRSNDSGTRSSGFLSGLSTTSSSTTSYPINVSNRNRNTNSNYSSGNSRNDSSSSTSTTYRQIPRNAPTPANTRNTNNYSSNTNDGTNQNNEILCNCNELAVKLTVTKESANKGRKFYVCSKPRDTPGRCNFFLWDDVSPNDIQPGPSTSGYANDRNNRGRSPRRGSGSGRGRGGGTRNCGICHEPGHTRNTCPNR